MHRRLGPLRAEVIEAESAKFTAPMVLLHGLWSRALVWRRFMGYLSHRGWQCLALERRIAAMSVADIAHDVGAALDALEVPPILVGHDLGAVLALRSGARARAIVALAPLVLPPLVAQAPRVLQHAGTWRERLLGRPASPPVGYDAESAANAHESRAFLATVLGDETPLARVPTGHPAIIWMAADDPITSVAAARALANQAGTELHISEQGGHDLAGGPGWEQRVSEMHRWIVQRIGEDLLAEYEEPEE